MKLNRYEKVSAIFVAGFMIAVVFFTANLAIHQGWFVRTNTYMVEVPQVEGVFPGTKVKLGGLKLGKISKIDIQKNGNFKVTFKVFDQYSNNFTENTKVGFIRPFIIGERVLDVIPATGKILPDHSKVKYVNNFDFIEAFSGKELGPYLDDMKALMGNLSFLAKEFSDPRRSEDLIFIFDQLKPLLVNANRATKELNKMALQMTKHNHLKSLMANLVTTTNAVNGSLEEIVSFTKQLPNLGENTSAVMENLGELTYHMNSLIPTIEALAPDLPSASLSALQALQEALIVLQAMQKSFLLEGSVEEVRAERLKKQNRGVASDKKASDDD